MDIEKIIKDAEAVVNGDKSRRDILNTRMFNAAQNASIIIHEALGNDDRIKYMDVVEFLPGLAFLVGALNNSLDHETGGEQEISMELMRLMMICGYQASDDILSNEVV